MHVTSITELKQWQTAQDAKVVDECIAAVDALHPGGKHDVAGWPEGSNPGPGSRFPNPQKITSDGAIGTCLECGEPEFTVRNQKTGLAASCCRACINAVRRQSLQHYQYTEEICCHCEIIYDSLGLISGANHHVQPFQGLQTLIDAGKVIIDDETGSLTIE